MTAVFMLLRPALHLHSRAAGVSVSSIRWMSSNVVSAGSTVASAVARSAAGGGRPRDKQRVVIVGSGWGGFAVAKKLDPALFDVHLVSPRNHMVFTPLLTSAAVGTLEFRGIAEPLRTSVPHTQYHLGKCRGIDPVNRTIRVESKSGEPSRGIDLGTLPTLEYELPYDALVVAVGAAANTFGLPGVKENVFFLKELAHARAIRKGISDCLETAANEQLSEEERARILHFVIVGGGPTGVEFCAELTDFIEQDLKRIYPQLAKYFKVSLVEGRGILGSFDQSLREYTMRNFHKRNIEIRTGANVTSVSATRLELDDGNHIDFGMCVWSTGVGPRRLLQLVDANVFAKTKQNKFRVNSKLQVLAANTLQPLPGIYSLGDCADVEDGHYASLAQVAEAQGLHLARELNALAHLGKSVADEAILEPYHYKFIVSLAYIGNYLALSDFSNSTLEGLRGKRFKGWLSWMLWRSAYLSKLGSWRNRLQVPMDWTRTILFGRDLSNF